MGFGDLSRVVVHRDKCCEGFCKVIWSCQRLGIDMPMMSCGGAAGCSCFGCSVGVKVFGDYGGWSWLWKFMMMLWLHVIWSVGSEFL